MIILCRHPWTRGIQRCSHFQHTVASSCGVFLATSLSRVSSAWAVISALCLAVCLAYWRKYCQRMSLHTDHGIWTMNLPCFHSRIDLVRCSFPHIYLCTMGNMFSAWLSQGDLLETSTRRGNEPKSCTFIVWSSTKYIDGWHQLVARCHCVGIN